jgi:hypothetical protein
LGDPLPSSSLLRQAPQGFVDQARTGPAKRARQSGGLSFGDFSLAKQRKVTRSHQPNKEKTGVMKRL